MTRPQMSSNQSLIGTSTLDLKNQAITQVIHQSSILQTKSPDDSRSKNIVNEVHNGFRGSVLFEHTMKDIYSALEYKLAQVK